MNEPVSITNTDFWVKIVEMLQQNWAVIEPDAAGEVRFYFVSDTGGVFDEMALRSTTDARQALQRNGFRRFADGQRAAVPSPSAFLAVSSCCSS